MSLEITNLYAVEVITLTARFAKRLVRSLQGINIYAAIVRCSGFVNFTDDTGEILVRATYFFIYYLKRNKSRKHWSNTT